MNSDIEHAHQLLSHLAPEQIAAVVRLMEVMLDPVSRALANAPVEDEEISDEEETAIAESREWLRHTPGIPFDRVVAELGFTMEEVVDYRDIPRVGRWFCLHKRKRILKDQTAPSLAIVNTTHRFATTSNVKRSRRIEQVTHIDR